MTKTDMQFGAWNQEEFVVSLATVKNADRIVVLEDGRIREMGSHSELVEHRGYYYNLVKLQGLA